MDNVVDKVDNPRGDAGLPTAVETGNRLGIMAKAPQAGLVKTRLSPPLTLQECAAFQHLALGATLDAMAEFAPVLFCSGNEAYFRDAFPGVTLVPQGEGDLGERMARALLWLAQSGAQQAALIGSDSPDLPPALVHAAFAALDTAEVACIPALDGGYVLIAERGHHPALFHAMPWSTDQLLSRTRERCASQRLRFAEVSAWEDVDDLGGLLRLVQRSPSLAVSNYATQLLQHYGVLRGQGGTAWPSLDSLPGFCKNHCAAED